RQLAPEQLAVGGQADVIETELADLAQEGLQARTDQRFTAGDTQALDTGSLDQIGHTARHGVGGQLILSSDQTLAVRHTVGAGVIAGGGQTDAKVAKASALAIDDHGVLREGYREYIAVSGRDT